MWNLYSASLDVVIPHVGLFFVVYEFIFLSLYSCKLFSVIGHSPVASVVVGTNQGGVFAFSIDVASNRPRESKSPVLLPIGKCVTLF